EGCGRRGWRGGIWGRGGLGHGRDQGDDRGGFRRLDQAQGPGRLRAFAPLASSRIGTPEREGVIIWPARSLAHNAPRTPAPYKASAVAVTRRSRAGAPRPPRARRAGTAWLICTAG